jgi:hypothetical protein
MVMEWETWLDRAAWTWAAARSWAVRGGALLLRERKGSWLEYWSGVDRHRRREDKGVDCDRDRERLRPRLVQREPSYMADRPRPRPKSSPSQCSMAD